jgi:hypothetical protein
MALLEVYEQLLDKYIADIRADFIDYVKAPPIATEGLSVDECIKKAEEYHKKGDVSAYLYFLATAFIKKGTG